MLSVNWIFAAWKSAKAFSERKYTDEQFINEHKLQIFAKCVSPLFFQVPLNEILFNTDLNAIILYINSYECQYKVGI